jgi:hypothetical protein
MISSRSQQLDSADSQERKKDRKPGPRRGQKKISVPKKRSACPKKIHKVKRTDVFFQHTDERAPAVFPTAFAQPRLPPQTDSTVVK